MLHGHGGDVYSIARRLGIRPEQVLDFSSNCSPLPYPEGFTRHLCENMDQMHLLPEVDCATVRRMLADRYNLDPDDFLVGSGTTQWIFGLPRSLSPKRAFVAYPTYADYEDACSSEGIPVTSIGTFPSGDSDEAGRLAQALETMDDRSLSDGIVFVCNPNNPTGLYIEPSRLLQIISEKPSSLLWVIDESYAPFMDDDANSSLLSHELPENVVILRSFSKIYGIPGLRVGCMVGRGEPVRLMAAQMRPWAVNRLAQIALEYLLNHQDFEKEVRSLCRSEKDFIVDGLSRLRGFGYVPGRCHFALFRLEEGLQADRVTKALEERGILVRNCRNFNGLHGDYIRISPRLRKDNQRLVDEIERLLR